MAGTSSSPGPQIAAVQSGRLELTPARPPVSASDFRLLGDLKSVIHLDAEVPHRRLELGVPEQQLSGPKVLRAPVDQRCLGPAHRVRPVLGAVKAEFIDPVPQDSSVLSGAQMRRVVQPARKQEVLGLQPALPDPGLQDVSGSLRDLELDRSCVLCCTTTARVAIWSP